MSKSQKEKIEAACSVCGDIKIICRGTYQQVINRNGFYRCSKCSPQRTNTYWDNDRKKSHSDSIKSSDKYYDAISRRDLSGSNNGMFGRTHSSDTKKKMSFSRRGKFGKIATAWKGGKTSFTNRVKSFIAREHNWFNRVLLRDYKCIQCGAEDNLDAHHIEPIVAIINRITKDITFIDEDTRFKFVISHQNIIDNSLSNGITLCRTCHKETHNNWGSHVTP